VTGVMIVLEGGSNNMLFKKCVGLLLFHIAAGDI